MSSGVEFEEDKFMGGHQTTRTQNNSGQDVGHEGSWSSTSTSRMSQWLMKHGIKTERGAQIALFTVVIFNIIVTILVINYFL